MTRRLRTHGAVPDFSPAEWIGGKLSPPFVIGEGEGSYRCDLAVWLELPSGLVVGYEVIPPGKAEGAIERSLRAALKRPLAGSPRRPARIRVASADDADEVRAVIDVPVTLGPIPELDEVLDLMLDSRLGQPEDRSYFEGGRISPAAVAGLFGASEILYHLAPWKATNDSRVLRMDIPELDVRGACVSIVGRLGQERGFLVFPSLAGYRTFLAAAAERPRARGRIDLGTDWLSLGFEPKAKLPSSMRREAAEHGWRVAGEDAYPLVLRFGRDGSLRPLTENDVKVVSACAMSLAAFSVKHARALATEDADPICESYFDNDDLEVRFTLPYHAFPLYDEGERSAPPPVVRETVGRNDPCPCGSGRKYKKCHQGAGPRPQ